MAVVTTLPARNIIPQVPITENPLDPAIARWLYENFTILQHAMIGEMFIPPGPVVVANTTAETTIASFEAPANWVNALTYYMMVAGGHFSTHNGSVTFTLRIYLDGVLIHTLVYPGGVVTNRAWLLNNHMGCLVDGVSGQMMEVATLIAHEKSTSSADIIPHAIDTTQINTLTLTVQWSIANPGSSLTMLAGSMQIINNHITWGGSA